MTNNKLIEAWLDASEKLKIKVQSPFFLITEDNRKVRFELLIENFGSLKGTLIQSTDKMENFDIPKKYGYYYSALNPKSYLSYNRQHFIETLNDWGYFGDESETPDWYTGESWTE